MHATVIRPRGIAAVSLLAIGLAQVGDSAAGTLTVSELQGTYDLKTYEMRSDRAGDGAFDMISERLEISADTLTFAPTFRGTGPFALAGDTLTVTHGNGQEDVIQASFRDTGTTLTLVDEIGKDVATFVFVRRSGTGTSDEVTEASLQGRYDLDAARSSANPFPNLDSGELEISGSTMTTSLTFSQTRPYALVEDTIVLSETDGDTSRLRAHLNQDGNTLTLASVESHDTFVYVRRSSR